MILTLFTIRDSKANTFAAPFTAPTRGMALRMFADHVNDPQTMPNKHPEDFELFELATYDDQAGTIDSHTPTQLGSALEYKEKTK